MEEHPEKYEDIPPLIPHIDLVNLPRKIVRRMRRKDERIMYEHLEKELTKHHEAHIEDLKRQHKAMLASRDKPPVYELELNDTEGLIWLPDGKSVIIQGNYFCRMTDPITGMDRIFGLSPDEIEGYYEDDEDQPS